ncbi:hypothetical protein K435DRAFT_855146 [Dendrothele bispora CBS 962.96]|uniref:Uncharacterized protein n=1 Tax=Dendrothele bispora (strain CBS 962.96) TaxID=1314807 RepID=A0A4S8MC05_DENBC|nr:hypothetical protein K435DRAFT_855146 [Dendrothele bispora CBS 962.96]
MSFMSIPKTNHVHSYRITMPRHPHHLLPGHMDFNASKFRRRARDVLDNYVPASTLLTTLGRTGGVVLGSVAHHVATPYSNSLPTGIDIAVAFDGFEAMFTFLDGQDLEHSIESAINPWLQTTESVHNFRHKRKRRFGPGLPQYLYVRLIRLKSGRDTLYHHLLSSPTTAEMTYLTPSSWVTFYPAMWQARASWFRWNDFVNQYIRDKQISLRKAGFKLIDTNETHTGPCVTCPASTCVLPGNEGIFVFTHSLGRRRSDVHGRIADNTFKDIPVKWKFSVQCFNANCILYQSVSVREPSIFFAPSPRETVECNTDEHCNYKLAYISSLSVKTYYAILLRPNHPPNLVPVFLEPSMAKYVTIDSVSVELWFAKTGGDVWSLTDHRLLRTDVDGDAPGVMHTLYVSPRDSVHFDRYHECCMLLVKHTADSIFSFAKSDLRIIKRYIYEWLDPSLADSDSDAGWSDCYADSAEPH